MLGKRRTPNLSLSKYSLPTILPHNEFSIESIPDCELAQFHSYNFILVKTNGRQTTKNCPHLSRALNLNREENNEKNLTEITTNNARQPSKFLLHSDVFLQNPSKQLGKAHTNVCLCTGAKGLNDDLFRGLARRYTGLHICCTRHTREHCIVPLKMRGATNARLETPIHKHVGAASLPEKFLQQFHEILDTPLQPPLHIKRNVTHPSEQYESNTPKEL